MDFWLLNHYLALKIKMKKFTMKNHVLKMDLHSNMTMNITSKMTSPVNKTAETSKWLREVRLGPSILVFKKL
jgi:hypothetical protein